MPAIVEVFDFDGNLIGRHEFATNKEAIDLVKDYMGKNVDVKYLPICCPNYPLCQTSKNDDAEILDLLDIG